jgi:glutamate racemase
MTIGVFDSGVGGLSFFRELDQRHPSVSRIYLGDHANLPYGLKSQKEIVRLTNIGVSQLIALGCTEIVIACNTASVLAASSIKENLNRTSSKTRIFDISSPTIGFLESELKSKEHASEKKKYKIGVFATLATVKSSYFSEKINGFGNAEVQQVICHELVEVIENYSSIDRIRACIYSYVHQLKQKFSDTIPHVVILGCTHYSVVREIFDEALGESCEILSQESLLLDHMLNFKALPVHASTRPVRRLLTTGDASKASMAAKFLSGDNYFDFEHLKT